MPCMTEPTLTAPQKLAQRDALSRLQSALAAGTVQAIIGRNGGIAFKGWLDADRKGVSDLCAYRALMHAPEMRRAVFRAEAQSGAKLDPRTIAAGMHSHDGGSTWSKH